MSDLNYSLFTYKLPSSYVIDTYALVMRRCSDFSVSGHGKFASAINCGEALGEAKNMRPLKIL